MPTENPKQLYEIVNPSDQVCIEASDEIVACVAVLLLGEGAYGLTRCKDDKRVLPITLLGGGDQWLADHGVVPQEALKNPPKYGEALHTWIDAHAGAMIRVYESAFYGDPDEHRAFEAAMAAIEDPIVRAASRRRFNDERRSSIANIGERCLWWAHSIRELYAQRHPDAKPNPCCGNAGTVNDGGRTYCATCGQGVL